MEKIKKVFNEPEVIKLLTIALEHEWAVSLEYLIHAYSMPKARFFYLDPVMAISTDVRAQIIQVAIDEMYHSLQLGIILRQMGEIPTFSTNEIIRYPRIIDNLRRDKLTEDMVTELYQTVDFPNNNFPLIKNMVRNIAGDEVRHSRQFQAMIDSLEALGEAETPIFSPSEEAENKAEVKLLHEIMRRENELMHRYLFYTFLFSDHQDLSQRLFKNSINHMRHWDKNSGLLLKLGSIIKIEGAERDMANVEKSLIPMPASYPLLDRKEALSVLLEAEKNLARRYEELWSLLPPGEIKEQIALHLALNREHIFTLEWLVRNALQIWS